MKREEFERLKEEEKKHLREIRDLKQKLKAAQRIQRIGRALTEIEQAGKLEGFDISLEEVQRKAAEQEARLDLVVENAGPIDPVEIEPIDEEALQKARAAEFIKRMKVSMEDPGDQAETAQARTPDQPQERKASGPVDEPPVDFEKTIGRMTPRGKGK